MMKLLIDIDDEMVCNDIKNKALTQFSKFLNGNYTIDELEMLHHITHFGAICIAIHKLQDTCCGDQYSSHYGDTEPELRRIRRSGSRHQKEDPGYKGRDSPS